MMTIFPNPSQRKLAALLLTELFYILGCLVTNVPVEGGIMLGLFSGFIAGNYGEHKEKANGKPEAPGSL